MYVFRGQYCRHVTEEDASITRESTRRVDQDMVKVRVVICMFKFIEGGFMPTGNALICR